MLLALIFGLDISFSDFDSLLSEQECRQMVEELLWEDNETFPTADEAMNSLRNEFCSTLCSTLSTNKMLNANSATVENVNSSS